jgi:hypothetical protein
MNDVIVCMVDVLTEQGLDFFEALDIARDYWRKEGDKMNEKIKATCLCGYGHSCDSPQEYIGEIVKPEGSVNGFFVTKNHKWPITNRTENAMTCRLFPGSGKHKPVFRSYSIEVID